MTLFHYFLGGFFWLGVYFIIQSLLSHGDSSELSLLIRIRQELEMSNNYSNLILIYLKRIAAEDKEGEG